MPVFDRTLPVKQMHVLEALDLLILRADKGAAPFRELLPSGCCSPPGAAPLLAVVPGKKGSVWSSVTSTKGHGV